MSDRILPTSSVLSVEGEMFHYVVIDLVESEFLAASTFNRHGDQCDVGEWWPLVNLHQSIVVCSRFSTLAHHSSKKRESQGAGVVYGVQERCLLHAEASWLQSKSG